MDLCDRNDIQALLARHGFRFAKSLGQNFLIRGDVAEDIAAAGCVSGGYDYKHTAAPCKVPALP